MKVPVSWLKEWVAFEASPKELAERLTFSGTEVEGIETVGRDCPGLVVGEVLSVDRHPDADRLRLCVVEAGGRRYRVVCGAENVAPGQKAAFAPAGVTLPNGMLVRETRIRGEPSQGMLCAEDEIGLSGDHSGIFVLPQDSVSGKPLSCVVGDPETVLSVEITWNRPDCLSIMGIAREVAALFNTAIRLPDVTLREDVLSPVRDRVTVEVSDVVGCPRYTARLLDDVVLAPSPAWMQKRLSLCGIRPINNVVDVTNYVMIETGHPLHAFDYDLIEGSRILVRRFNVAESFVTLDGVARRLTGEMLVIADARRPVALAGVMGGAGSEIREGTQRVLLESACFAPASIHRTSVQLGLATESSHRFERGVDIRGVEWASRRAASLMALTASARISSGVVDIFPHPPGDRSISFRYGRANRLLGMEVGRDEMTGVFGRLGLKVTGRSEDACTVSVPSFRGDLEIEADLIEEVARVHGLDSIPVPKALSVLVPGADDERERSIGACRSAAVSLGFSEAVNYSFTSQGLLDLFSGPDRGHRLVLPNPVSSDHSVMRDSLLPQMAETIGRNVSRQVMDLCFFEMGRVFGIAEGAVEEMDRICLGISGKAGRQGADIRRPVSPEEAFLWIKGAVESLAGALKAGTLRFVDRSLQWADTGWAVAVQLGGSEIGVVGLMSRDLRHKWRISEPVGLAELAVAPLLDHVFSTASAKPLPMFPGVARDVAFIADESVRHEAIVGVMLRSGPAELTDIKLFDTFRGEGIGPGKRSLAYTLMYRSAQRTLTDEEANAFHDTVKNALREELKVEIREN